MKMSDPNDWLENERWSFLYYFQWFILQKEKEKQLVKNWGLCHIFLRWYSQVSNLIWSGSGVEEHCAKLNQIRPAAC